MPSLTTDNTSVFILAAGRGERMRPLTDSTPKPLLKVNGKCLIDYHIEKLITAGFTEFIINIDHLGKQIIDHIGDGGRYSDIKNTGKKIEFKISDERKSGALETAGGIAKALPLLSNKTFICVNADVWTDFNFTDLLLKEAPCLVLTANPKHNLAGDFIFDTSSQTFAASKPNKNTGNSFTFSGIGLYQRNAFEELTTEKQTLTPAKLAPLLYKWAEQGCLNGIVHTGIWHDIGTPERLAELNQNLIKI